MIPAPLRERQHWEQGMPLVFVETDRGVLLLTRDQTKRLVREQLSGSSLVDELIAERRRVAELEDVG